jgi:hypothetical protein
MRKAILASLCVLALNQANAQVDTPYCSQFVNSSQAMPQDFMKRCGATAVADAPSSTRAPTDIANPFTAISVAGGVGTAQGRLGSHALNNYAGLTFIGTSTGLAIFALDNAPNGTVFGITGNSTTAPNVASTLFTLNRTTGAATQVAALTGLPAGFNTTGLAIHPVTGAALVSAAGGTPAVSQLFSLNLTTGALTLIGTMGGPAAGSVFIDIATNCTGQTFATNVSDDALYSVNTTTGAATLIGPLGFDLNFAQGMDFDNGTNELYAWGFSGTTLANVTTRFGVINLATGNLSSLGTTPIAESEGLIVNSCPAAPVQSTAIPVNSLNAWGIGALAFLLGLVGFAVVRRRA